MTAPAAPKTRIALWDNARFVLILLVVLGHSVTTVRTDTAAGFWVYATIYLFHMPGMILLSGVFSKPEATPRAVRSTLQLLAVWLLWEGIWAAINFFVEGRPLPGGWLVSPAWTLWFLVTLATMRILLPYLARLRHPLVFSVLLALVAGLSPAIGGQFSASRTLCFLPFFVAGWLARERGWLSGEWFLQPGRATRAAAGGLLLLVGLAVAVLAATPATWRIDKWLTWRDDYARLFAEAPIAGWQPQEWWAVALGGMGVRFALLAVAALMILALLLLVPRGHGIITVWGTRTLFVYLLHGPTIYALRVTGAADAIGELGVLGVGLLLATGSAIAVLLSMTWVARVFRPLIEPRFDRLYARAE